MALGTPAIVSNQGALPEVAGNAGAIVLPLDQGLFRDKITKLLTDKEDYLRIAGRGQSGVIKKRWSDYALEIERVYEELL
jgi:glycosyltransferase involved in cell wall biosynthesis